MKVLFRILIDGNKLYIKGDLLVDMDIEDKVVERLLLIVVFIKFVMNLLVFFFV